MGLCCRRPTNFKNCMSKSWGTVSATMRWLLCCLGSAGLGAEETWEPSPLGRGTSPSEHFARPCACLRDRPGAPAAVTISVSGFWSANESSNISPSSIGTAEAGAAFFFFGRRFFGRVPVATELPAPFGVATSAMCAAAELCADARRTAGVPRASASACRSIFSASLTAACTRCERAPVRAAVAISQAAE